MSPFLVGGRCHEIINVCGAEIQSSDSEKLLGVKIESILNFKEHLSNILTKASHKISALPRVTLYMGVSKKRNTDQFIFTSQFSYCPLILIFHSRTMNNKIYSLH